MRTSPILRACMLVGLMASQSASYAAAPGLLQLYRQAQQSSPQFLAAQAEREAAGTLVGQAGGQFLPQLSAAAAYTDNNTDVDQKSTSLAGQPIVRSTSYNFITRNAALNLSLAVFRPQLWASYAQAKAQVRQAEGALRQAEQDLILRVSQAYFDVLLAEDAVRLAGEQKAAIQERLKQAKRYFEAGLGTITDINEAQARYDVVSAQGLTAINTLEVRRRALEAAVGSYFERLQPLATLNLEQPEPNTPEAWQAFAQQYNPLLKAREAAFEVAQQEVYKNASAHLPTVDLVAGRSWAKNPGYTTVDSTNWNTSAGVQVNIPLFSGGTTQGRVSQAQYNRERARHELEGGVRAVQLSVRQEFLNVVNGVAQVNAFSQAVKSNELALHSAKRGLEAGVRTSFDVLNAQTLLFSAKRDLAESRYAYVMARLKLRAAAGLLAAEDVQLIESWLGDIEMTGTQAANKQQELGPQ